MTNAHVVTPTGTSTGRPQLRVQLHDGDAYEASVRDVDRKADIATIKVNPQVSASTADTGAFFLHPVKITMTLFIHFFRSKVK